MAFTLTSLAVQSDGLHLIGSEFTKTTMTVYVDGLVSPHTFLSSTNVVIDNPAPGSKVHAEKGELSTDTLTTEEPAMSDQSQTPAASAPISADDILTEQEKSPNTDPIGEPQPLGPAAELVKVGAKEPYPSGSPAVEAKEKVPMNEAPPEATEAAAAKEA